MNCFVYDVKIILRRSDYFLKFVVDGPVFFKSGIKSFFDNETFYVRLPVFFRGRPIYLADYFGDCDGDEPGERCYYWFSPSEYEADNKIHEIQVRDCGLVNYNMRRGLNRYKARQRKCA